jgi:hypothetical protein
VSRCSQENGGKEINGIVFAGGTRQQVASVSWHRVHKFGTESVKKLNKKSEHTVSRCSQGNGGKEINGIVLAGLLENLRDDAAAQCFFQEFFLFVAKVARKM